MKYLLMCSAFLMTFFSTTLTHAQSFSCSDINAPEEVFLTGSFSSDQSSINNFTFYSKNYVLQMKKASIAQELDFEHTYSFKHAMHFSRVIDPNKSSFSDRLFGQTDQPDSYLGSAPLQFYWMNHDVEFSYSFIGNLSFLLKREDLNSSRFMAAFFMSSERANLICNVR